jgi:hypothetical protein
MTESPTLTQFKTAAREAFGYLGREFACQEVEPPQEQLAVNPFILWFANRTTLVQVEGTNWGFAAQVILGPAKAGNKWRDTVPLWAILKHRRPDLYQETARSAGQLGDIRLYANALKEAASDVLRGDFRVFAPARAMIQAQTAQQPTRQHPESWELRRRAAVASAMEAFRGKDYRRVVDLLLPFADALTPAERAKLDYARTRT